MRKAHKHIVYFLSIVFIFSAYFSSSLYAVKYGEYQISDASRIWFEGSSTVNDFTCMTYDIDGLAILDSVPGLTKVKNWKDSSKYFVDASFNLRVKSLECGNDSMNEDMFEALKADKHNKIKFSLIDASLIKINEKKKETNVKINGFLTVAGKSKIIPLYISIRELVADTKYRIMCNTVINMKDFGIETPTALLGLIKVDEKLTLFLDLFILVK
jgi:hypothetical protein